MSMVNRAAWNGKTPSRLARTMKNQQTMKILVTAILALAGIAFATPKAEACDHAVAVAVCRAPYRVSTCEVHRCSYCKTAYNHCGYPYHYTLTVITYRASYSDGSATTYTRSYRS